MKRTIKPNFSFTDQAKRDIDWCRAFLRGIPGTKPARRIREIHKAARLILDSPKLYPVEKIHPVSGLDFRRKNVGQFAIIYAYLEPTSSLPNGEVSIRAVRHGAKEDVLFRVEEPRSISEGQFPRLRTGHHFSTLSGRLTRQEVLGALEEGARDALRDYAALLAMPLTVARSCARTVGKALHWL